MRTLALAAAMIGGLAAADPAAALPLPKGPDIAPDTAVEQVAWYCNARGHCIQARRPGYAVRYGWAPRCRAGWRWNGYRCYGGPGVTVRIR